MAATPFPIERDDTGPFAGVGVVRLAQEGRPVVVLDHALIQRLDATLDEVPRDLVGLVLASASERVFVAGADLKAISKMADDELDRYLAYGQRVFGRVSQLPFPTAAAINGAALGGGLEVAMHCDALIGAPSPVGKPYQVGLPEAGLCICPGWAGTNLLPARLEPGDAMRRTATGRTMPDADASKAGLFDLYIDDPSTLIDAARSWVVERARQGATNRDGAPSRWIGRSDCAAAALAALEDCRSELEPSGSVDAVLDCVNAGLTEGWQSALDHEREHLCRLRRSPEGVAAIEAFFARSSAKS